MGKGTVSNLEEGAAAGGGSLADLTKTLGYLRPYRARFVIALILAVAATAATLGTPQLTRILLDRGIVAQDWTWVIIPTVGLVGLAIVYGLCSYFQVYLSETVSQGLAFDLRDALFVKLHGLSFGYHDKAQTGQVLSRLTSDVQNVQMFAAEGVLSILVALLTFVGTAVALAVMQWKLALICYALIPVIVVVFLVFAAKVAPVFMRVQQNLGRLNTVLEENLVGAAVVRTLVAERHEEKRYSGVNRGLLVDNIRVVDRSAIAFPVISFVAGLGTFAVLWLGGHQVLGGRMSIGTLAAFLTYMGFLLTPILQIGATVTTMTHSMASATRVVEVLEASDGVKEPAYPVRPDTVNGSLGFTAVSFRYPAQERPALEDVTFSVEPGEKIALVGPAGSGKSTLLHLVPRFYEPGGGTITLDGVDIRRYSLFTLRSYAGMVLQDPLLFAGTIRENLIRGNLDADEDEMRWLAEGVGMAPFIESCPQGYDTRVEERGLNLSGGQKQKLVLARTLLMRPRLLLLDDALSSLDTQSERAIVSALDRLSHGATCLFVARRPSTAEAADRVIVLDGGHLVGEGGHEDLLASHPVYADVFEGFVDDWSSTDGA